MSNIFKKAFSVFVTTIILNVCIFSFSASSAVADENTRSRTYWRHDYSSSNLSSYYEYDLSLQIADTANLVSPAYIFGENDMVRDYDTSVVRLSVGGTGFIVGNHLIATAGHCVYDIDNDKFINNTISIVDENNEVIDTISSKYVHVNKNFATASSYSAYYDYALIYVEEDLSEYGMFYLGAPLDNYITTTSTVTVSGFPASYPNGYEGESWGIRFKADGNILPSYSNSLVISYNADMTFGDSGGPVYFTETRCGQTYNTVIAVNACQLDGYYNKGVRITSDLLKFYYGNSYITT